ncbi:putative peptide transport system permease protein BRA1092/BS1330_II1084 [Arthrobacter sp. Hiyo8]|nr:putative peptide transport system permease protein BRA1092/BS1330_II1084 [Arthrobacter sp. Hiyo8]
MGGDMGNSWITNTPVGAGTVETLGVSVTLMACAVAVATVVATALCVPSVMRGWPEPQAGSGVVAAAMTALPEFLLAAMLLVVGAVWLGWFPPYGWQVLDHAVLPALALGLPAGGLIGRLLSDAISVAFAEKWVATWAMAGASRARLTAAVLRRALPSVMSQIGLVLIGLTGGAVAVEKVFAIPGLGRAVLGAASAQDIPALQAGVLALLMLAIGAGSLSAAARNLLMGAALRSGTVPVPDSREHHDGGCRGSARRCGSVAAHRRRGLASRSVHLEPCTACRPGLELPFGADASGRTSLPGWGMAPCPRWELHCSWSWLAL